MSKKGEKEGTEQRKFIGYWEEIRNAAAKDIPTYWKALHLDRSESDLVALLVV
jgi:hypothetical protein